MISPFIAFINGMVVDIIWLFGEEFTKRKNSDFKVKTDFCKVMSVNTGLYNFIPCYSQDYSSCVRMQGDGV